MARFNSPQPWVGGYTLDVYCDYQHNHDEPCASGNFYGRNAREAKAEAKAAGWRFNADQSTTCRFHRKVKK